MGAFSAFYNGVLDIIFGKSNVEKRIRSLRDDEFVELMRPITYKDGTVSLFRYENPLIHDMIHALKYRGNQKCAVLFATALTRYLSTQCFNDALIVPVPLAPKRKAERGHNQIELILEKLPSDYHVRTDVLAKIRNTKPQTSLQRKERIHNLTGAYKVQHAATIKNMTIILVDDVTTTGTTLKECSTCLMKAGAREVRRIALAR